MGFKKFAATMETVVCLVSVIAISAKAAGGAEDFYVYLNGGAVVSNLAVKKDSSGAMWYHVEEKSGSLVTWVQGREIVNLRGRTEGGGQCTELVQRSTRGSGTMNYLSGYGKVGSKFRLAVQYDSNNPYSKLELTCSWIP